MPSLRGPSCLRHLRRLALLFLLVPAAGGAQGNNTIGAEQCKACHEFEYQVWAKSAHNRSQAALSSEQVRDPKCNTCHTVSANDPLEDNAEPKYGGIDCERCHGPGKYYHPRYVMKDKELARAIGLVDLKPAQCMQCHSEGAPSISAFDYEQLWARIEHGRSAREAWARSRGATAAGDKVAAPSAKPAASSKKPGK